MDLSSIAKGIVSQYFYNPKEGLFPSNLYNRMKPQLEAQRGYIKNPTEQNRSTFINTTASLAPTIMGVTGNLHGIDPTNVLNNIEGWKMDAENLPLQRKEYQQTIQKALDWLNKNGFGQYTKGKP